MQPEARFITIAGNIEKIQQLLTELVLQPRLNAIKWSRITKQTPNIKIGYPGQHLASLITGMEGERTGARGNDLVDGTEVKSCSRIDQLDKCKDCDSPVARMEIVCSACGSSNIDRKNDSKWLFSIRSDAELHYLTHEVKRVMLFLGDYPYFDAGNYDILRFQTFEIWPQHQRNSRFSELMTNYYEKIYLEQRAKYPTKTPAPNNFWPDRYQFYLCNPIPTFECWIQDANTSPHIELRSYVEPQVDRSLWPSALMPTKILREAELNLILENARPEEIVPLLTDEYGASLPDFSNLPSAKKFAALKGIDEKLRSYLPLRDTNSIAVSRNVYQRRSIRLP